LRLKERTMAKVTGTIRINANPGSSATAGHFEVIFVPYAGRFNTKAVRVSSLDDLVTLLMNLKISEDEATSWAGKARTQGVVLISGVERTESQLQENGLLG
jgi:hypothetical protein